MRTVNITINDKPVTAADGCTILAAADSAGVQIPTLCFLKNLDPNASCRICVVEVEGSRTLLPSCATKVSEGMVIRTDTSVVRKSRKTTLELLLARHSVDCHHCMRIGNTRVADLDPNFCEMCFFCDCVRDGFCELQSLAREYEVDALPYKLEPDLYPVDSSTGCVVFNPNKCIKCRRCVDVCTKIQTVHALSLINRGADIQVMPSQGKPLAETPCVLCGRCAQVCPTGAMHMLEQIDEVLYQTHNYDITTIAQISDDVLDELAELSKIKRSELSINHVVAGLKKIGVDYVVTEEAALSYGQKFAAQYIEENISKVNHPIIITSSHSAVQFINAYFPSLQNKLFYYDSAQQQFGKLIRGAWKGGIKVTPSNKICSISITSSNDNEGEAAKNGSVDYVVNARELYRIFLRTGVNLKKRQPLEPDRIGAGVELTPALKQLFKPVTWEIAGVIDELDIMVNSITVKAAIGKTLGHTRQLLEQVKNNNSPYKIIKISS